MRIDIWCREQGAKEGLADENGMQPCSFQLLVKSTTFECSDVGRDITGKANDASIAKNGNRTWYFQFKTANWLCRYESEMT